MTHTKPHRQFCNSRCLGCTTGAAAATAATAAWLAGRGGGGTQMQQLQREPRSPSLSCGDGRCPTPPFRARRRRAPYPHAQALLQGGGALQAPEGSASSALPGSMLERHAWASRTLACTLYACPTDPCPPRPSLPSHNVPCPIYLQIEVSLKRTGSALVPISGPGGAAGQVLMFYITHLMLLHPASAQ